MDCGDIHFSSYVYTGFELGKAAIQLTEDLQKVFGVDAILKSPLGTPNTILINLPLVDNHTRYNYSIATTKL